MLNSFGFSTTWIGVLFPIVLNFLCLHLVLINHTVEMKVDRALYQNKTLAPIVYRINNLIIG